MLYIIAGLVTFFAYARDKRAAKNGSWRITENTLHTLSLLCGWPAAIIAQQIFRHKTKKANFRVIFWFTVLVNSAGLLWLHFDQGSTYLRASTSEAERIIFSEISAGKTRNTLLALLKFHT